MLLKISLKKRLMASRKTGKEHEQAIHKGRISANKHMKKLFMLNSKQRNENLNGALSYYQISTD